MAVIGAGSVELMASNEGEIKVLLPKMLIG
jgi:hypothetical protein